MHTTGATGTARDFLPHWRVTPDGSSRARLASAASTVFEGELARPAPPALFRLGPLSFRLLRVLALRLARLSPGLQGVEPVQCPPAGGPPFLLAHVCPLVPEPHAVLQSLAAAAREAGCRLRIPTGSGRAAPRGRRRIRGRRCRGRARRSGGGRRLVRGRAGCGSRRRGQRRDGSDLGRWRADCLGGPRCGPRGGRRSARRGTLTEGGSDRKRHGKANGNASRPSALECRHGCRLSVLCSFPFGSTHEQQKAVITCLRRRVASSFATTTCLRWPPSARNGRFPG